MVSPADIVNQSLEYAGNQVSVGYSSGSFTGDTTAAAAATVLYAPTWQMVARQLDPDFARRTNPLVLQSGGNLPPGWMLEYAYPSDCLRLRTLAPPSYDPFDPQLILGNVAIDVITGSSVKVIYTNQVGAHAVYTSLNVNENEWDSLFREAVCRQLANPLSMALQGRPDYARELLQQALQYEQLAELRDESSA